MSQQTVCDGCGKLLSLKGGTGLPRVAISGERMNGCGGGGMPDGRFDWCQDCAPIAFQALREARATGQGAR
jgi:hypothetical protein